MAKKKNDEELKKDIDLEDEQNKPADNTADNTASEENNENNMNEEENEKKDNNDNNIEEAKKQEEEGLQIKLLRLQADFINYKNRTEKEKYSTYANAVADVITDLLPVIDNFERALETDAEDNALKEGLQMVYSQFMGILNKKGLQEIDALNKPFDPNYHFGVAFGEGEAEDNTVIEIFQKGYTVNDKVIRPAMVKVCKR